VLDHLEHISGLVLLWTENLPFRGSLHHHHADRVRDYVMQLARDASAFQLDGKAGSFIALLLQLPGVGA
jgi:hypothetical protein